MPAWPTKVPLRRPVLSWQPLAQRNDLTAIDEQGAKAAIGPKTQELVGGDHAWVLPGSSAPDQLPSRSYGGRFTPRAASIRRHRTNPSTLIAANVAWFAINAHAPTRGE